MLKKISLSEAMQLINEHHHFINKTIIINEVEYKVSSMFTQFHVTLINGFDVFVNLTQSNSEEGQNSYFIDLNFFIHFYKEENPSTSSHEGGFL
jgi:hypothetical protein